MQSSYPSDFNQAKPKVVVWYTVYCGCFFVLYLLTAVAGGALALFAGEIAENSAESHKGAERISNLITGVAMIVISVVLCGVFIVGLLIPRKKWGWIYGFIPIAIGLTSPCCMPASIPLLLFWLKPDSKRWFNVD